MNHQEASRQFSNLSSEQQLQLLAAFGHNLSIVGRDTYDPGVPGLREPERLRAINEIQHRVFALIASLAGPGAPVPSATLLAFAFEYGDPQLQIQVQRAFVQALESCG